MKSRFLLFLIIVMLLVLPMVSADWVDWDNYKVHKNCDDFPGQGHAYGLEKKCNPDYGVIEVWDWGITEDTKLSETTLNYNTFQCLTGCKAGGFKTLYEDGKLFDSLEYEDSNGDIVQIEDSKVYYLVTEEYQVEMPDFKETCESANGTEYCYQEQDGSHFETLERKVWVLDTGEELEGNEEGITYEWEIRGKKNPKQSVDWIVESNGERLTEWAWWNTDWKLCEPITITNSYLENYSHYIVLNITNFNYTNAQSDLDDLRFLEGDCSNANLTVGELGWYKESVDTSENSSIWFRTINANITTVAMYYNNSGAVDTSNITDAFLFGEDFGGNALDTTEWGVYDVGGSTLVGGGVLNITTSGGAQRRFIYSKQNFSSNNIAIDMHNNLNTIDEQFYHGFWNFSFATDPLAGGQQEYAIFAHLGGSAGGPKERANVANSTTTYFNETIADLVSYNGWHNVSITIPIFDNKTFWLDDAVNATITQGSFADDIPFKVVFGGNPNALMRTDWIRVRKIVEPAPTYVLGSEEEVSGITSTQSYPIDYYNETTVNTVGIGCNFTALGKDNITSVTLNVYDALDNLDYTNTETGIADTVNNKSYNKTWTTTALTDDIYKWACNGESNNANVTTDNRTFTLDLNPPVISIFSPVSGQGVQIIPYNITLNYTAVDPTLQSCWYNSTWNVTITPLTCNQTLDNVTVLSEGIHTIYVFANDTFGNEGVNSSTFYTTLVENSQTFNSPVVEGVLESFSANVTISGVIEISAATLIYNNTYFESGTINSIGQNRILDVSNFQIPDFTSDVNTSFYWSLNLSDSSMVNLSSQIQEVRTVGLDNCSTYTTKIFNISLFDEELKTPLQGTIELFFEVQNKPLYTSIQTFSTKIENINTTEICSNINLSEQNLAYSLEIRYYADGYAAELYYIQKADLVSNVTNIHLFDLNLTDSTEFLVQYENSDVVKIEGAVIQLLRKYISEDVYEVVEAPLTGNDGTAIVHVDLNSNKYKAIVIKDGVVLDIFENIVFKCENELSGQCNQNLFAAINPQNSISIEQLRDFTYSVSENNGTVTTTFSVPSGVPSTVNIELSQTDQFGNESLCNKTIISSGGSVDCTYSTTIGESYLKLKILKNEVPQAIRTYIIPEAGAIDFLGNNFFIVLIFLLSIIGMAFTSPEWIVINSVVTMLVAGSLWLLSGLNFVMGLGGLMWLIVAAAILIMKITKQEDR